MLSKVIEVKNSTGLHARPAASLAKAVKRFSCRVTLHYEGNDINAASMMNIMRAGIKGGKTVEIRCEGNDEADAMQTLVTLFRDRFGEAE
ncbi:HPr family phosphocarrier protein [Citrobacter amalonaticus]|uniref:Phosphocarrier protein NPr n=1 Tax=Citrobacter amalonaticus TaxID=35703 RepID=A0A2S4RUW8_CITAM|nr:HPr family phosphocarrier protein [Citrobacter amalonaticus]POT55510.1 HPr family phosphocarrier protein [Citrobacter amalonaticus]POT73721.1 HPr family phosphocarrier protein [Citrobacter amalonaticus]POU63946.1 HPr family phosphocarrier protein [Citrobacter amalonaticus]POV03579.1 HPr family phosphocarrier protein [Citrobacter amalonaticus]